MWGLLHAGRRALPGRSWGSGSRAVRVRRPKAYRLPTRVLMRRRGRPWRMLAHRNQGAFRVLPHGAVVDSFGSVAVALVASRIRGARQPTSVLGSGREYPVHWPKKE